MNITGKFPIIQINHNLSNNKLNNLQAIQSENSSLTDETRSLIPNGSPFKPNFNTLSISPS